MKITISIMMLLLTCLARAQNDTIVIYYDHTWKPTNAQLATYYTIAFPKGNAWYRMDLYAETNRRQMEGYFEDKALEIKTGPFKYFHKNGSISSEGYFHKNKKVGLWKSWTDKNFLIDSSYYNQEGILSRISVRWNEEGTVTDSIVSDDLGNGYQKSFWSDGTLKNYGSLEKGKKQNRWTYYHKNGKISQEVIYEADSAMQFNCFDINGNAQKNNCHYEKEAEFKGGIKKWQQHIVDAMSKYLPADYFKGNLEGYVVVSFVIGVDGKVISAVITYSNEPKLNDAALKIITSSPLWEPAVQYNRPVVAYRRQPLTFVRAE